ncbi:tRNA-dihydrouridine(20a/20b) synthase [NAD(P)+]-like isoform X2 [Condylostylus longicornis]|uniref:tRNA-dihydrouridine(20a/20b) synthase [NAD(P)+]-like isoform X2 n=1 Tax=Condylostylus longicornis TaxID=2530218 RepID=UPI00244E5793|nr:tRNA-dihydrouridine(20a/20b) synthase [NAD(P)+]-like isoform X2 [Condylostylus longicornis]
MVNMTKPKTEILQLFSEQKRNNSYLNVAAPMVRYSKLEFRKLLRKHKTHLCFTPMIVADSFCRSEEARNSEFTTSLAQFAAKDAVEFQTASQLVYPYVDGVDINCGCPQSWAISKSYGCALLRKPELIQDMIKSVQRVLPNSFSCSVKMRLLQKRDLKSTVDLSRQLEKTGATFISIHGRTPRQKTSEPADMAAVSEIKKSLTIPIIYNGDIKCLNDANTAYNETNCDGIMSARGLLSNPTLFTGTTKTTNECLQDWVNIGAAADMNISFQCFHHHLTFMMEKLLKKKIRTHFNNFTTKEQIFSFMLEHFNITPELNSDAYDYGQNLLKCDYNSNVCEKYKALINENTNISQNGNSWNEKSVGKYFLEHTEGDKDDYDNDQFSFMGTSIFD